ncbi:MAG: DUF1800 domain-containing protein [Acidimicrobiales bacterium]|nr:DUF1800 domain-containing protein [Acidimicrobiales bacterium]
MPEDDARSRIAHLYRRAGFGARPEELDAAVAAGYEATVDRLVDLSVADGATLASPTFTPPAVVAPPADEAARRAVQQADQRANREEGRKLSQWWIDRMVLSTTPLRERLTLFWHDHFATSVQKVKEPELMYRQNEIFRARGAGSFEALAQAVAKDPAMLIWLDANENRKGKPNENFARELFELFLLGIGNYSEADVQEGARAFTGWQYRRQTGAFALAANQHDAGAKTVFGQTGTFGGEDVIRMAVAQPASAPYVVSKLWSGFARPVGANDPVVRQLAPAFAKDQDVGKLMRAILLHPEFVAPAARTGLVKTPIEYVAGALRALGLRAAALGNNLPQTMESLGQQPFAPPSVGGWPPNGYWLTTSFALSRLRIASTLAGKAKLDAITAVPAADRPAAVARLLSVDGWGPATSAGLAQVAGDPKALLTVALVAPEYGLA